MRAIASARLAALEAASQPQAASSPRGERGVAGAQEEGKACVAGAHENAHENGHAAQGTHDAHDAYGSQDDAQDPQGAAPPPWARLAQTWRDSQARVLRATLARAAAAAQPREEEGRLEAQGTKRRRAPGA